MSRALSLAALLLFVALSGCSAPRPSTEGAPAAAGMMGGDGELGMLAGAIAAQKNASLVVGPNASTAQGVRVTSLLAPSDGWLVVRAAGAKGAVLGKTRVPKGSNRNVLVRLDAADGADVRVAFHVDQGMRGVFEFDPAQPEFTLDKPVVVNGSPLEARLALSAYGVEAVANSVLILVQDQPLKNGALNVGYLLLPATAWISVNVVENGLPGRRVGLVRRAPGESQQVSIAVEGSGPRQLVVTVFADKGEPGEFEFSPTDPLGSADQPFKSAGVVVSQRIQVN